VTFGEAIRACLSDYVTFSGRARRAEYWWFALFNLIGTLGLTALDLRLFGVGLESTGPFVLLFSLAILLPAVSVMVRRLHDTGRSGWWFWITLIPLIGGLVLIVWLATPGDAGANDYGPDPLRHDPAPPPPDASLRPTDIPKVPRR
jgi:uncharacterized membrane protein YhaH (DUF805 family)